MSRKKAEREKRCSVEKHSSSLKRKSAGSIAVLLPEISATLLGVLSLVSGISDSEELIGVADKCRQHGMDLHLDLDRKKTIISSRQLEGRKLCSSRQLCG